jgi:hypothetical protein
MSIKLQTRQENLLPLASSQKPNGLANLRVLVPLRKQNLSSPSSNEAGTEYELDN